MAPHIIINGTSYRLYKIGKHSSSPWWIRVQHKGVRRSMSTGTTDTAQAKERAAKVITAALTGQWLTVEQLRTGTTNPHKPWPTFNDIFQAAQSLPTPTAKLYIKDTKTFLTETTTTQDITQLTIDILTPALAFTFLAHRQGLKKPNPALPTPHNTAANIVLQNTKNLFGRKAIAHYEKLKLDIPDLSAFLSTPLLSSPRRRYSDTPIKPTTWKEIDAALSAASAVTRKTLNTIRLHGTPPGNLPRNDTATLGRFLKRWNLTPLDIHHHAGASMYRRTTSLQVAAKFTSLSLTAAKWHWEHIPAKLTPLSQEDTIW